MQVNILVMLLHLSVVGALLDGSITSPSTNELLNVINQLKQTVSILQQTVNNSQQTISGLQQNVNSLQQIVNNSQQNISSLQHTINGLNRKPIAFSATLTQAKEHLGNGQVIQFDRVLTNVGSGYEPRLGHFTAPKAGTYIFTVTAMGYPGKLLALNIVKNGVFMEQVYSDSNSPSSPYTVATETIILHLEANDMIWVTNAVVDSYINGGNHNSFSGFLIQ